jgi:hypothetical protein
MISRTTVSPELEDGVDHRPLVLLELLVLVLLESSSLTSSSVG